MGSTAFPGATALLLAGGTVRSGHDGWRAHDALLLQDGQVRAIGAWRDVRALAGSATRAFDLAGGCALPGLSDAHVHILGYALGLERLDVGPATSPSDLRALVARAALGAAPEAWITGRGWDQERWPERRMPSAVDLDDAAGGRPVLLWRACGHVAVASSRALELAGLGPDAPDPPGGRLDRNAAGRPTGLLRETAAELVARCVPAPTADVAKRLLRRALRECLALGITQVQTDDARLVGGIAPTLELFHAAAGPDGVPVRVTLMIPEAHLEEALEGGMGTGWGDEWLRLGQVKVFADGSLGARTAALREPYADALDTSGVLIHSPQDLAHIALRAHAAGCQLGVHAIGDAAAAAALAAIAGAQRAHPRPDARHRLIHCLVTDAELLATMRRSGVVADLQPGFLRSDGAWVLSRLGPERLARSYAFRTIIEMGIPACGGSDCPIEPLDPMVGISQAVTRSGAAAVPSERFRREERLTVAQALDLWTRGAAFATFEEGRRGTLAPGMAADVSVLGGDPFSVAPDELAGLRARATVVGGLPVHAQ